MNMKNSERMAFLAPVPARWLLVLICTLLPRASSAEDPQPTQTENTGKELDRFRAAIATLDSSGETQPILRAMETLRTGYPQCRPVLLDCFNTESVQLKCFALQVLGEQGAGADDIEVVSRSLRDQKPRIRLAAIMALRRLGKGGYEALAAYFPGETDNNNKKMAAKTFQVWNTEEALPLLVKSLEREKEKTVRNFFVTALESLTHCKLGDDPSAWKTYLESLRLKEQARELKNIQGNNAKEENP